MEGKQINPRKFISLLPGIILTGLVILNVSPVSGSDSINFPRSSNTIEIPESSRLIQRVLHLPGLSNVGIVSPGIVRGAQPEPEGYQTLRNMGIRTVINLRTTKNEKEEVEALGMRSIEIPISMVKTVDREKVDAVLAAMHDPANQPVYVHCKLGQDRTGIVIASYRVAFDHWTREEAEEEMQLYGFNDLWLHLKHFLNEYVEDVNRTIILRDLQKEQQTYLFLRDALRLTMEFARSHGYVPAFNKDSRKVPGRDEKMRIWSVWGRVLDHYVFLDRLGEKYVSFFEIDDADEKKKSFQMTCGVFLAEYRFALEFLSLTRNNPLFDTLLNEEVPEFGIPKNTLYDFKLRFLNITRATEFAALNIIAANLNGSGNAMIQNAIKEDSAAIADLGGNEGVLMTIENAGNIIKTAGFAAWFPVQKGVSKLMGDIRVRRGDSSLVSKKAIEDIAPLFEPGDIILQRREWYLSNLGLPGFWTHAALYIGDAGERRAFFSDRRVTDWVHSLGGAHGGFEDLLERRFTGPYVRSMERGEDGTYPRVLEAIAEGVSFTSIEHSAAADSLVVLRPRLPKKEKAHAILRAFQYSGRPYDFNFDFLTDSSLVCSELVYKVYEPAQGFEGLRFLFTDIMGRKMVTPNGIAEMFDRQYGTQDQKLDMIVFLDGNERSGTAPESTVDEFRKSWQRPKWHIIIQDLEGTF